MKSFDLMNWPSGIAVWRAGLASCRRLAQWFDSPALSRDTGVQQNTACMNPPADLRAKRKVSKTIKTKMKTLDCSAVPQNPSSLILCRLDTTGPNGRHHLT